MSKTWLYHTFNLLNQLHHCVNLWGADPLLLNEGVPIDPIPNHLLFIGGGYLIMMSSNILSSFLDCVCRGTFDLFFD